MQVYVAAPIVGATEEKKEKTGKVISALEAQEWMTLYNPGKHDSPNAWGMSLNEWARVIFALDVVAIDSSDWIVVCDYGRQGTAGTAWECGYAFGKGKKVLIIEMYENDTDYSVMMRGCSANYCKFAEFIKKAEEKDLQSLFVERGRLANQGVVLN